MDQSSRAVRIAQIALLVVASLVFVAGACELGLRLFWGGFYEKYLPPRPGGMGASDFHPTRGLTPAPNTVATHWDPEYHVVHEQDSRGFRGDDFALEKAQGTTRILTIGDSTTFGIGVENEETYSAVLEQLDARLHVVNAGVPGYGTGQELLVLREEIAELAPDVVVVGYFWNDLWDSADERYARFELRDGRLHHVKPEPASFDHPSLAGMRRRYERRSSLAGSPLASSRLYRFLSDRTKILSAIVEEWFEGAPTQSDAKRSKEDEENAWQLAFAMLREMQRLAREHGAELLIVVIPDQLQVEQDIHVRKTARVISTIQERLRAFGEREGIAVFDPLAALREIRARQGVPLYYRRDRHMTPAGQRHLGELLLAELRRLGMTPAAG